MSHDINKMVPVEPHQIILTRYQGLLSWTAVKMLMSQPLQTSGYCFLKVFNVPGTEGLASPKWLRLALPADRVPCPLRKHSLTAALLTRWDSFLFTHLFLYRWILGTYGSVSPSEFSLPYHLLSCCHHYLVTGKVLLTDKNKLLLQFDLLPSY